MIRIFAKLKNLIFDPLLPPGQPPELFLKNLFLSIFFFYQDLTSRKKLEKSNGGKYFLKSKNLFLPPGKKFKWLYI